MVIGVRNECPVPVQEPEVNAPRVHADAFYLLPPHGLSQPLFDLVEDPQDVPVQPVGEADRQVGEAVDLLQGHVPAVEATEHHAPAFGPEIHRQVPGAHPGSTLPENSYRPEPTERTVSPS